LAVTRTRLPSFQRPPTSTSLTLHPTANIRTVARSAPGAEALLNWSRNTALEPGGSAASGKVKVLASAAKEPAGDEDTDAGSLVLTLTTREPDEYEKSGSVGFVESCSESRCVEPEDTSFERSWRRGRDAEDLYLSTGVGAGVRQDT
jgi:hypothetical protein